MSTFRSYLSLQLFQIKDLGFVLRFYLAKYLSFLPVELCFFLSSFLINPYRHSRRYLFKKGAREIYAYGETPLKTLCQIASEAGITSQDTLLELGSGRGRGSWWLAVFTKCKVIGIEQKARAIPLL